MVICPQLPKLSPFLPGLKRARDRQDGLDDFA